MAWNCPGDDRTCHCGKFDMILECANGLPDDLHGHVFHTEIKFAYDSMFQPMLLNSGSGNTIVLARYAWRMSFKEITERANSGSSHRGLPLWASNFIGALKLLTLVLVSITGLAVLSGNVNSVLNPTANLHNAFEGATPNENDIGSALVSIVFSSAVYYNAFNVVNEIKSSIPILKKNTSAALLVIIVLYSFYNTAYFAVVPKDKLKEASDIAASNFFTKLFGGYRTASDVLNLMVLLNAFGNLLAVLIGNWPMIGEIRRASTKLFGTSLSHCLPNFAVTIIMIIASPDVVSSQTYPSALFDFAMATGVFVLYRRRKRSGLGHGELKSWDLIIIFLTVVQVFVLAMP
ncbi:hypothetical protein NCS52_01191800 [Fusarium sp. LHS14.1]|nr:hypothetical protein NCS52_01191800 [Fusarium sp. LHS14.1]